MLEWRVFWGYSQHLAFCLSPILGGGIWRWARYFFL